jgi:hypothetical protein
LRIDLGAGKGPLNAFDHDPVTLIETGFDDPELTLPLFDSEMAAPQDGVKQTSFE